MFVTKVSAGPPHAQDTVYAWYVSFVMAASFAFSYMDRSILPLLVGPLEHSLHLTDTTFSLLQGAAFAVFYALFGIPLARVIDNGHRRNLILVGVVVWSLATAGCGLARTIPELFLGRIVVAIGEAVLAPAAVSILADYFSPRLRTRSLSIYSMGVFIGGGLSLNLGGTLLHALPKGGTPTPFGVLENWRIVFLVLGLASLALLPLLLAVKEPHRLSNTGGAVSAPSTLAEIRAEFSRKRASLFACIIGFATVALGAQTMQAWSPALFIRVHHWSTAGIGQRLGAFSLLLGPLGALTGAFLAERLERAGRRDGKLIVGMVSALACIVCSVLGTLPSDTVAFAGVVFIQFFSAFNFGLVQAALSEILPNRMRAIGSAAFIAAANLLAATLGPLMVGLLNDYVFHDPNMVGVSMRLVAPTAFAVAALILGLGLRHYRAAIERG